MSISGLSTNVKHNHEDEPMLLCFTSAYISVLFLFIFKVCSCSLPLRADWAHWYDSLTPTFIIVCVESFEFPLLPRNRLLNILATWKVMDCIHGY